MKTRKSLYTAIIGLALGFQAHGAVVLSVNYGVDLTQGWLTNGTAVDAVNLGPTGGVTPATVNGITFATQPTVTGYSGAPTFYSSSTTPNVNASIYSGNDSNLQNLYWTGWDINAWSSPSYAAFVLANPPTPGHVY